MTSTYKTFLMRLTVSCLAAGSTAQAARAAPRLTTLISFDGRNGSFPAANLAIDKNGNLFGTSAFGGTTPGVDKLGDGTVFKLSKTDYSQLLTILDFDGTNGAKPAGALVIGSSGKLYGATSGGGSSGDGTAFSLSGTDHETLTTLVSFKGSNGSNPTSGLVFKAANDTASRIRLYGTTVQGGASGNGTVFELSGPGSTTLTTILSLSGSFAEDPGATLIAGPGGVLYGTDSTTGEYGQGTVFELSGREHETLTTLATFNGSNGAFPLGALAADRDGNLYGTTSSGGPGGDGIVFELSGTNHATLTTLVAFAAKDPRGTDPVGQLLIDAAGDIYGTTSTGGASGDGTVFKIAAKSQTLTVLHSFSGTDGSGPMAGLVSDTAGDLFGTTAMGGANSFGTVFELAGGGFRTGDRR